MNCSAASPCARRTGGKLNSGTQREREGEGGERETTVGRNRPRRSGAKRAAHRGGIEPGSSLQRRNVLYHYATTAVAIGMRDRWKRRMIVRPLRG